MAISVTADGGGENKAFLCKYQVDKFIVMNKGEKIITDHSNIISIEYLNDYDFLMFSMLKVTLRMDIRKRLWILKNKSNITAKFSLNKIGMEIDNEEFVTSAEEVWNIEFAVEFNDEDDATDVSVMEERIALNEGEDFTSGDIETENYYESQNIQELYLFHPDLLKSSRKTLNTIFKKVTLQNAIGELMTESKHKNVLMSKIQNDTEYEELLIPAEFAYRCLIYMDQYMGLYEQGAMIFYDVDTLYILNANGEVTAKREGEWTETCFMIRTLDSSIPGNGMIRVPGHEVYYINISEMDINPQKFSIGKNIEVGSSAKMVVADGVDIDILEADQSYIDERNEKVMVVDSENKYHGSIVKKRMEENECILYINGQNLDINAFTPNKTYKVFFEETNKHEKYGKFGYRIAYAYHYIKPESESYMSSSHKFILKKASGPVTNPT